MLFLLSGLEPSRACSILYYIDTLTGKIYAVNNEDYWYDVKTYLRIEPRKKEQLARLWYGWDDFAQGGINEAGLFFDGASTPEEKPWPGYVQPKGNLGDRLLARCTTVGDALEYLEEHKVALTNGHLLIGDKTGNAVVVEWMNGQRHIVPITGNQLLATNFLLSDTARGNYPCPRYRAMEEEISKFRQSKEPLELRNIGQVAARAMQPRSKNAAGREGGTLYSTFINITDMEFVLVYQMDNAKMHKLDLKAEFAKSGGRRTIRLE
jgi:choloylglycine hydrolase